MKTYFFSKPILLLSFFFVEFSLLAQKEPLKLGKIDPPFLTMDYYDYDSTAEALILGDYGSSDLEYVQNTGWIINYSRHCRIKVFKSEGLDWADQSFVLYNSLQIKEDYSHLKAFSYNLENGKIVKSEMTKEQIFVEEIDNKRTRIKFTIPDVKPGTVFEFRYEITSNDLFQNFPWQFQYSIPAMFSEYRISYPTYFYYKHLTQGYIPLTVNEHDTKPMSINFTSIEREGGVSVSSRIVNSKHDYTAETYRLVSNNVPAFRDEPYMNSSVNYVSRIDFELGSFNPPAGMVKNFSVTWERITSDLIEDEDFGLYLGKNVFLKEVAAGIKEKNPSPQKQMVSAFELIRDNMEWNGANRLYLTKSLRKSWDDKIGSSADINLLLVSLLKELELNAEPVIISTRDNGMIHPAQIMLSSFNHVIASVLLDNKIILLDATEKMCPWNMLPGKDINGQGRVISSTRPGWVDLNQDLKSEYMAIYNLVIQPDGILTGSLQTSSANYAALNSRIKIKKKANLDEYIKDLQKYNNGFSILNHSFKNLDSLNNPLIESYSVQFENKCMLAGNLLSFVPLLSEGYESNPFRLDERKFPVDFIYPYRKRYTFVYTIPEGYTIEEKPSSISISLPENKGKFRFRADVIGARIQVSIEEEMNKSLFSSLEYPDLKEFFNTMVKKEAEPVVLRKL